MSAPYVQSQVSYHGEENSVYQTNPRPVKYLEKTLAQVFSCEFFEILQNKCDVLRDLVPFVQFK